MIFLCVLFALSISTYFWSKNIYLDQIEKNLSQNIDSLSLSLKSFENIDHLAKTFKEKTGLRITIIDKKGKLLADSDNNIEHMENHLLRYEIVAAKNQNYGKKIRYSKTINQELLYVAKKVVINDEVYYIRLADYTDKIIENFSKLAFQIIAFIVLFMIIAFVLTYMLSIKIKNETDAILTYLINLSEKKPNLAISSSFTQEFDKITKLLNKVALKLEKRQKQKAKQTAKLKLANKQKDEIISAISHEFKNPISVISGYSQTLLVDKNLPQNMRDKFLEKIYSNGIKMSNLIDKLRLCVKLEENKQQIHTSPTSLHKICSLLINDLQDKYPNRKILFKPPLENKDIHINIDETLFSMVLENLVENALKYSDDEVILSYDKNKISIKDKGIGISQEDQKNINQKFFRVSQNGWNNSLGLGLFIVNSIISLHNFKLEISSVLNKGSEFKIYY